jgi:hypothetical protein
MFRICRWLIVGLCCWMGQASAIEPFHAGAVPAGHLEVRLYPTEVVTAGTPTLVTFGIPFPRGSINADRLSTLRVTRNGVEIPAFVEPLTPWRHRTNAALDLASVRFARVQIRYTFAIAFPASETIAVTWGVAPRTQSLTSLTDPRSAWHVVASGSFVAADNVREPDVYAALPASWLALGAVSGVRSTPFSSAMTEARDDPAAMDATLHWPAFEEAERAHKNNFFTLVNRDDPLVTAANYPPYKTEREPWLYDRAATMYHLYLRSGYLLPLREAVQAAGFFGDHLDAQGFFTLAPGDSKYAYNESLAYTYWLTGDPVALSKIDLTASAHNGYPHVWTPTRNFWTERHAAFKLLAQTIAYEVNGGATRRDTVEQTLADFRAHQDGAGGAIPSQRIDGGMYHFGEQHDGDWDDGRLGGSSWMSALLSDAVVRAYATGEDAASARFVRRLGLFLRATMVRTDEHSYDTFEAPLWLPRYAMLIDGTDGQRNFEDIEHALDVAGQLAWAFWMARQVSEPAPELKQAALDLYASYDEGVNYWIRPSGPAAGLPAFRVAPPRKWGWEHRVSTGLAFALEENGPNAGYSGLWFEPATNGQGFQFELNRTDNVLVAAWYTYLPPASPTTRSRQLWLTGAGKFANGSAQIELVRSRGAEFDAGAPAIVDAVGSLTVHFDSCTSARASYAVRVDGVDYSGDIPLTRLSPDVMCARFRASGDGALTQLPPPVAPGGLQYGHGGSWYDVNRPGQGFLVESDPEHAQLLLSWFSYDYSDPRTNGSQPELWLSGLGTIQGNSSLAIVYLSLGASFDSPTPPVQAARAVGTLRFTAQSCTAATAQYEITLPGASTRSGTIQLRRVTAADLCL